MLVALIAVLPAGATTGSSGSAAAASTLLSVTLGSTRTSVAVDRAISRLGKTRSAEAALDFLAAGTTTIGGSRSATSKADSGSLKLGTGPRSLSGVAGVTLTGGSLDASVADDQVRSAASITMVGLDLAGGLLTAGTGQTTTTSLVTLAQSEVTRSLRIGTIEVLSVRALLNHLGVDPTDLACTGVEAAGSELGVDTSPACETLGMALGAISDAGLELDAARSILVTDLQTVQATVAGLTLVGQPLIDLAATYGIDVSGLLGLLLTGPSRDSLITEITRRMDAVDVGIAGVAGGTCSDVATALSGVQAEIPSMNGTLAPLAAAADVACDALGLILDALLDVSIIRLDGVRVSLMARAIPGAPFADGSGSIGVVGVGNRTITAAGISSIGDTLAPTVATLRTESGNALSALGIATFPTPEITLLGVEESTGRDSSGAWKAHAAVTGVRLRIPSVPITLPGAGTLGVLGPTAGAPAAPLAATPVVTVEAAVFSGDAVYKAAGDGITGVDGGALPNTGVPAAAAVAAGALMLGASIGIRRLLIVAR